MELNDQDIALIEQYLEGQLSGSELSAIEARMADPEFAAEVDLMRDLIGGTRAAGRQAMKAELGAIGAAMLAGGEIAGYEPSQGAQPDATPKQSTPKSDSGSGSGFGSKVVTVLFLAAAGYGSYLWFTDQMPPPWLQQHFPASEMLDDYMEAAPASSVQRDTLYQDGDGNTLTMEEFLEMQRSAQ